MALDIRSVAVLGASGNIGAVILDALRAADPPFKSITALTRSSSGNFPADVSVKVVDYTSHTSLVAALTGIDAVVSSVGSESVAVQSAVVDAAAAAGVRLFVPSEFGLASNNAALNRDFFIFEPKVQIQQQLAALAAAGTMDYKLVFCGLWLDWAIADGFLLNVEGKTAELWDGGAATIPLTTRASVAKAILAVLRGKAGDKTEVRIKDVNISQKRLLELAMETLGRDGWKVTDLDTKEATVAALKKLQDGTGDVNDVYQFVKRACVGGEQYDVPWKPTEDDSEALGLDPWSEDQLREVIRKTAASS